MILLIKLIDKVELIDMRKLSLDKNKVGYEE